MTYSRWKNKYVEKETAENKPAIRTEANVQSDYDALTKKRNLLQLELDKAVETAKKASPKWDLLSDKERQSINAGLDNAKLALAENNEALNKLRIEGAKKKLIFATELAKSYDAADLAQIRDKVRKAPENIRILWNLAEGRMKVLDTFHPGTPHYSLADYGIRLNIADDKYSTNQKAYRTTFHELGHLIDHWLGKQMYFQSPYYKGGIFGDTLRREAEEYINATFLRLKREAVTAGKSVKSLKKADAYKAISDELKHNEVENLRDISDIWHGATNRKVAAGWGHERKNYWTEDGGANLAKEAFAHMFQAVINNPESLVQIKRYFPESYKIFEEMIKDETEALLKAVN